jgi:hypothetical protein
VRHHAFAHVRVAQPCQPFVSLVASLAGLFNYVVQQASRLIELSRELERFGEPHGQSEPARVVTLERACPVEQVHCSCAVQTKHSVLTCPGEKVTRAVAQRSQRLIDWTELGPIPVSPLEVVADDLLMGARVFVEPVSEALVQLSTDFLRDPAVRRVADQDVAEAEAILIGQARALRLDEASAHKPLKKGAHLRPGRGEMEESAAPELLADHGCRLEQRPLFSSEPIETGGEQCLDRVGHGQLVAVLGC